MRCVLVAVLILGPAVSHAQGLGDAARKEKSRQKANAAAGVKARSVDDDALKSGAAGTGQGTFSQTGTASSDHDGPKPVPEEDASHHSPRSETGVATSGTEDLQRRIETWRGRYRPAKARVESLEREIAELEAKESKIAGIATDKSRYRDPNLRTDAERTVERLPRARKELDAAREQLRAVEDGARRDGVGSGQLY